MEAKELLRELKRTVDELSVFNEIGKTLTSTLDLDEVLRSMMEKVSDLLKPKNWSLLLVDEEKQELFFQLVVGADADKLEHIRLKMGEGVAGWVAQEGKPLWVRDAYRDPRFTKKVDKVTQFKTEAILCVPLISKNKVLGVIELIDSTNEGGVLREEDMKILSTIADYAAIAIENARNFQRIQELTVTDDLTRLYNSRYMHEVLDREIARSRRYGTEFSLLFLDLDHFKDVNDQHGHLNGSRLLKEIAEVIQHNLRASDVGVRYGGDEFVLVLLETNKRRAQHMARRLRKSLNETSFLTGEGLDVKVTASFGLASFPRDAETKEEILRQADHAMYRVKSSGRNGIASA